MGTKKANPNDVICTCRHRRGVHHIGGQPETCTLCPCQHYRASASQDNPRCGCGHPASGHRGEIAAGKCGYGDPSGQCPCPKFSGDVGDVDDPGHLPEPWDTTDSPSGKGLAVVRSRPKHTEPGEPGPVNDFVCAASKGDARRIAACVNSMAGIEAGLIAVIGEVGIMDLLRMLAAVHETLTVAQVEAAQRALGGGATQKKIQHRAEAYSKLAGLMAEVRAAGILDAVERTGK